MIMTDWDQYYGITETQIIENNKVDILVVDSRRLLKIKNTDRIDYGLSARTFLDEIS